MSARISKNDHFLTKIVKIIPGEIIAAFLAIMNVLQGADPGFRHYALLASLVFLTVTQALYLVQVYKVKNVKHIFISCFSFLVWVGTIPKNPFDSLKYIPHYLPLVLLICIALLIPLLGVQEVNTGGEDDE